MCYWNWTAISALGTWAAVVAMFVQPSDWKKQRQKTIALQILGELHEILSLFNKRNIRSADADKNMPTYDLPIDNLTVLKNYTEKLEILKLSAVSEDMKIKLLQKCIDICYKILNDPIISNDIPCMFKCGDLKKNISRMEKLKRTLFSVNMGE